MYSEHGQGGEKSVTYGHFQLKTDESAPSPSSAPSVSQNMAIAEQKHLKTRSVFLTLSDTWFLAQIT